MSDPIVAVIGPSGSGKSAVARYLHDSGVVQVCPTWTTRPARADEKRYCVDHVFVSDAEFDARASAGFFTAIGHLPGLPHRYGLPAPVDAGRPVLVMMRAGHVAALHAVVQSVLVYQIVSPRAAVAARLAGRGVPAAETRTRLDTYVEETAAGRRLADRVFSNTAGIGELACHVAAALCQDTVRNYPGSVR